MHDHIIVYRKSVEFERNLLERTVEQNKPYVNDDNDGKGLWRSDNLLVKSFSQSGVFPIKNPNTNFEYFPPEGSSWRGSKDTLKRWLDENRIFFGKDGKGAPQLKRYLREVQQGRVPTTWWNFQEVGHNDSANKEMQNLFESKTPFDTPKPTKLLKQIFKIASNENDIVLDFFAGSGTTGHAIFDLNKEFGTSRKFILVQLPEIVKEKDPHYVSKYRKVSDVTIERNKRVVEKIIESKKAEQPDLFTEENKEENLKGLGFKVFKLAKSNFPRVDFAPDPTKTDAENVELLKKYIAEKEAQLVNAFNREELLTEILLKKGFNLNFTTEQQSEFTKNEILLAKDSEKETLICLDVTIAPETVEYFKTNKDQKFICLERALDTTKKYNLKHYLGDLVDVF